MTDKKDLAVTASNKKLDKLIEKAYYRLASGRQISVLKIPPLFDHARQLIRGGAEVDAAVKAAIEAHCEPETCPGLDDLLGGKL